MSGVEWAIYGIMAFWTLCFLTAFWFVKSAIPVDDNDYPIKCQIIPFKAKAKNRKAA